MIRNSYNDEQNHDAVKIPELIWDVVNEEVKTEKKKQKLKKHNHNSNSGGVWIRKFCYDVNRNMWADECHGCYVEKSLFFEYLHCCCCDPDSNDLTRDYISVKFLSSTSSKHNNGRTSAAEKDISDFTYSYQADHIRERILRSGILSPDKKEHFDLLGCSNSQVKNYTFLFRRRQQHDKRKWNNDKFLEAIIPNLQTLEKKKGVAKRVKYVGLLFSGLRFFVNLNTKMTRTKVQTIDSVERNGFDFTDGCGLISYKLAKEISLNQMKLGYVPSVFQIRYGGKIGKEHWICKGVLLVDHTETSRDVLSFRKSMMKVRLNSNNKNWNIHMNNKLGIVDFSSFRLGKLNQQVICLLSSNIPHRVLLDMQRFHFENIIQEVFRDPFALAYIASLEQGKTKSRDWEFYEQLIHEILSLSRKNNYVQDIDRKNKNNHLDKRLPSSYITLTQKRMRYCSDYHNNNEHGQDRLDKLQLPLAQSRTVFGVAFPEILCDVLNERQCMFFTNQGLYVGTVIVSRSPSYTPGDVRVLESIDIDTSSSQNGRDQKVSELKNNLRNCIIFATKGNRPESDKMSGGDMDGDLFLVIYDERLTEYSHEIGKEEAADYSSVSPSSAAIKKEEKDWIEYVSRFDNSMLGIVDRAFYTTAKEKGIKSKEAKKLNLIFSTLVDKNPTSLSKLEQLIGSAYITRKTRYSESNDFTSNGNDITHSPSCCIWEKMIYIQSEYSRKIMRNRTIMPDLNDYLVFRKEIVENSSNIAEKLCTWKNHFTTNVDLTKIETLLNNNKSRNDEHTSINSEEEEGKNDGNNNNNNNRSEGNDTIAVVLNKEFIECSKSWNIKANNVFALAFKKWDQKRSVLLKKLENQHKLKQAGLQKLDEIQEFLTHLHLSLSSDGYQQQKSPISSSPYHDIDLFVPACSEWLFQENITTRLYDFMSQEKKTRLEMIDIINDELGYLQLQYNNTGKEAVRIQKQIDDYPKSIFSMFFGYDSKYNSLMNSQKDNQKSQKRIKDSLDWIRNKKKELESSVLVNDTSTPSSPEQYSFSETFTSTFDAKSTEIQNTQNTIQLHHDESQKLLDELKGKRQAFLDGRLRKEVEFLLNKKNLEIQSKKKEIRFAQQELHCAELEYGTKTYQMKESQRKVGSLSNEISDIHLFKRHFDAFLCVEEDEVALFTSFFDEYMISRFSFLKLRNIISKNKVNKKSDSFWHTLINTYFQLDIDVDNNKPEEQFRSYYDRVCTVRKLVKDEQQKRQKILNNICTERCQFVASLENLLQAKKSLQSRIKLKKKKIKEIEAKLDHQENQNNHLLSIKEILSREEKSDRDKLDKVNEDIMNRNEEKQKLNSLVRVRVNEYQAFQSIAGNFIKEATKVIDSEELLFFVPPDTFLEAHKIVNEFYEPLKKKFNVIFESMTKRNKSSITYDNDLELFRRQTECFNECKKVCSIENLKQLQDRMNTEINCYEDLKLQVSEIKEDCNIKKENCCALIEDQKDLEVQRKSHKNHLSQIFCIELIEELETALQDTSHEDSLNTALERVEHEQKLIQRDWKEKMLHCTCDENEMKHMRKFLLEMNKKVKTIIDIEENRILGFPSNKNNIRAGRLPVYDKRAELRQALNKSNVVIVTAGTGTGKSTQLPQYILDDFYYSHNTTSVDGETQNKKRDFVRICCTQPRRLAAIGVATRVAKEYCTSLGNIVGFRVGKRGRSIQDCEKVSQNTQIEFVTEGLLLYELIKSPKKILNYDCIIVDEAHERNKETDLLLAFLRRYLDGPSTPIKVVVMSATINPAKFSDYFGGGCPCIDCPGRTFQVEEHFCPPKLLSTENDSSKDIVPHAVKVLFDEILYPFGEGQNYESGDVLVFFSGCDQIMRSVSMINERTKKENMNYVVAYPLFSQMTEKEKQAAQDPNHRNGLEKIAGRSSKKKISEYSRKIICCTNICETSLTIDRVRFVLEGGYAKRPMYDHIIRSKTINERRISQASAKQRKGRAGRTATGWCYYLYSESIFESMDAYDVPQIIDTPIDELILYSLKVCGKSIEHLGLMDCPSSERIMDAKQRLQDLDMIIVEPDGTIFLTEDGNISCKLSSYLDPQAVRMVLTSRSPRLNCLHRAIKLGAILSSEDDIFTYEKTDTLNHDLGDHFLALTQFERYEAKKKETGKNSLKRWCKTNDLNYYVVDRIQSCIEQCYKELRKYNFLNENCDNSTTSTEENNDIEDESERLLRACVSGYFSQLAEFVPDPYYLKQKGFSMLDDHFQNINIKLAKESCMFDTLSTTEGFTEKDDVNENISGEFNHDEEGSSEVHKEFESRYSETAANFVLYTNIFSIRPTIILIPKISLIDGKWIREHASIDWCDRVDFDENKPTVVRRSISNLGSIFLRSSLALYKKENYFEKLDVLLKIMWDDHKLYLYGKSDNVFTVKKNIRKRLYEIKREKAEKDIVRYFPDSSEFSAGLELGNKIRGLNRVDFFMVKNTNSKFKQGHTSKYWKVKRQLNGDKKSVVNIFINDKVNASIFCSILKKNLNEPKIKMRIIQGNKVELQNQGEQPLFEPIDRFLQKNSDKLLPYILDKDTLNKFAVTKQVSLDSLVESEVTAALGKFFHTLCHEWISQSPFWHEFCTDLDKKIPLKLGEASQVRFAPSRFCFEVYTVDDEVRSKVMNYLSKSVLDMLFNPKNNLMFKISVAKSTKSSLWKIAAVIAEARQQFSNVRFGLVLPSELEIDNSNSMSSTQKTPFTISRFESELERLEILLEEEYSLHNVSILLQCVHQPQKHLNDAREYLKRNFTDNTTDVSLPDETVATSAHSQHETKCCMCDRQCNITKSKASPSSLNKDLAGYELTVCGCLFCRQCFVNAIVSKLKQHQNALTKVCCESCDTIVLARDCMNIIMGKQQNKKDKGKQYYQKAWDQIITMSYENFCNSYTKMVPSFSYTTCMNCSTVMLYKKCEGRNSVFYCRNFGCSNLIQMKP